MTSKVKSTRTTINDKNSTIDVASQHPFVNFCQRFFRNSVAFLASCRDYSLAWFYLLDRMVAYIFHSILELLELLHYSAVIVHLN